MYRYFFIAKNNIRKQKSDMITFFLMIMISACLLFISFSFMLGIGHVLDTVHKRMNGPDILMMVDDDRVSLDKLTEIVHGRPEIGECEVTESLMALAKYGHKGDKELTEFTFQFMSYDQDIKIQQIDTSTEGMGGSDVVLPVGMSTSYKIGDTLRIKIDENIYDLRVAGFTEDSLYCSPLNIGINLCYVSQDIYNDIRFENASYPGLVRQMFKMKLTKNALKHGVSGNELGDEIFNEHNDWYSIYAMSHPDSPGGIYNVLPFEILRSSAMVLPMMFIGIVCLFAIIIFVIAMVIIHFSVKNFIMTNMKNTGVMEAAGYTVGEMVTILIFQLGAVSLAGGLIGVIIGALTIGRLGVIIIMTLGLDWNQPVNVSVAMAVVIGLCAIVVCLTLMIGRDYGKTTVLEALRGGINAHNFKKNLFPFEKSAFPVAVTLSLKETFGRFKSNIGIIFIVMILISAMIFGLGMADTFSSNDALMEMVGIDYADSEVEGDEAMGEALDSMKCVQMYYGDIWGGVNYTSQKVRDKQVITTRSVTDFSLMKGLKVIEGRAPLHPNEMMFATNAAKRMKVGVGDVVTVVTATGQENFIVSGLVQVLNNMGMMAYMTIDGYSVVYGPVREYNYEVFLKDGYDLDDFRAEFGDRYPDVEVVDFKQNAEGTVGVIKLGVKAIAILIALLTALIVAFVESLIIKTQITRAWRDLGVSKALGYTSGQLILQTMLSNMPSVLIGIVLGLIVSFFSAEKLMRILFSSFEFRKAPFYVNPGSYVIAIVLIAGIALLTSAWIGRRIRTLEPVKMITEE